LATIREIRERGVRAEELLGRLAHGLGLTGTERPISAKELAAELRGKEVRFRREAWLAPSIS
jgi:hypothetical protein